MQREQSTGLGIFEDTATNHNMASTSQPGDTAGGSGSDSGTKRSRSESPVARDLEMEDFFSDEEGDAVHEETGLTSKARRRHTAVTGGRGLDDIVAGNGPTVHVPGSDLPVMTRLIINGVLIACWYTFSLSISIYNKYMFGDGDGQLKLRIPLFVTSLHMIVQFSLATSVLFFLPRFRAGSSGEHVDATAASRSLLQQFPSSKEGSIMSVRFYLTRIAPCGLATGMDIGFGNMSLLFITLTFYTMCKSSALGFVLLFAFLFGLETPSWRLVLIIGFMTIGVIMMVAGEAAFRLIGFVLIITSSCCSGFRWALTQILLLRNPATSNPFSSIFYLAPIMFISLIFFALLIEGPLFIASELGKLLDARGFVLSFLMVLFPGCLAFLMTASEYALLQRTSVVTLSICGIFKEVLTVIVASLTFHDALGAINLSGLIVTIASIACYNYMKIQKMRKDEQSQTFDPLPTGEQEREELFAQEDQRR